MLACSTRHAAPARETCAHLRCADGCLVGVQRYQWQLQHGDQQQVSFPTPAHPVPARAWLHDGLHANAWGVHRAALLAELAACTQRLRAVRELAACTDACAKSADWSGPRPRSNVGGSGTNVNNNNVSPNCVFVNPQPQPLPPPGAPPIINIKCAPMQSAPGLASCTSGNHSSHAHAAMVGSASALPCRQHAPAMSAASARRCKPAQRRLCGVCCGQSQAQACACTACAMPRLAD